MGKINLKIESMISSTLLRRNKNLRFLLLQPSRRQRIAQGSGYEAKDVDKVLADFQRMRGFMKQMSNGGMPGRRNARMGGTEWGECQEWAECQNGRNEW